ncbi:MAG: hypothetical protein SPL51_02385 [Lachnospiraceae bacterium]|nr:hypothetical protein [Lachnospiraceae bacterium]
MMKRVDKVKRVAAISAIALMISLTGCGKAKDSSKEVTTKQVNNEVTSNQGESASGENDEAINELLNNIEVNGKHIDFPFTLNDLGDDFEFDNYVDMGDGTYGMDLKYKGETVAGAYVYADTEKDIDRKTIIYRVSISRVDEQVFKISRIDCNSTIEDVRKYMNKFEEKNNDNTDVNNIEYIDENYLFCLFINDEEKITSIVLEMKGE